RWVDNNGAYIRAPEPANLYRTTGNLVGAYRVRDLQLDAYAVCANKAPSTPNRGYGCQQLYFGLERLMDKVAERLGMDPADLRLRNFIGREAFPYVTPSGGEYDSGDFHAVLMRALDAADYRGLRAWQGRERARGRHVGIGLATIVDPSVSNMGYITVALDPALRKRPEYLPKSGSADYAAVSLDPLGQVTVVMATAPQGQGHDTAIAQVVADTLGIHPDEVEVVDEFDSLRSVWGISSGTYASRFASMGLSAVALAARQVRDKVLRIAGHLMGCDPDALELVGGTVRLRRFPDESLPLRRVAGTAHWNPGTLPAGMEPGLRASATFSFPRMEPPDEADRVNACFTYGFIADLVAVEVFPETGRVQILKYVTVHDAGRIINPLLVEGQAYGSAFLGMAGALFETFTYDDGGQLLCTTLLDYVCPAASEAPELEIHHIETPSPLTTVGSKGCAEGSSMSAPVAIANAVADALSPLGVEIDALPLTPARLWAKLQAAARGETR
ncbi:MAG: xanthine dehydrogenase family protein molybdopterin-binding subunit, partial [Candidatus Rokuibacteriota bacterium]